MTSEGGTLPTPHYLIALADDQKSDIKISPTSPSPLHILRLILYPHHPTVRAPGDSQLAVIFYTEKVGEVTKNRLYR